MVGFSVTHAARLAGISQRSMQQRVTARSIQFFRVNGRPFVTDMGVATCRKGGKFKGVIEREVFFALPQNAPEGFHPFPFFSGEALLAFVSLCPSLVWGGMQRTLIEGKCAPKDIFLHGEHYILCQAGRSMYSIQVFEPEFQNFEVPKEKYQEIYNYFLVGRVKEAIALCEVVDT